MRELIYLTDYETMVANVQDELSRDRNADMPISSADILRSKVEIVDGPRRTSFVVRDDALPINDQHPQILYECTLIRVDDHRTRVVFALNSPQARQAVDKLTAVFDSIWKRDERPNPSVSAPEKSSMSAELHNGNEDQDDGPTLRTQERAMLFKEIKDENPSWSQAKVAMEANTRASTDEYTGETVRNTYRAMKWDWRRGDRQR